MSHQAPTEITRPSESLRLCVAPLGALSSPATAVIKSLLDAHAYLRFDGELCRCDTPSTFPMSQLSKEDLLAMVLERDALLVQVRCTPHAANCPSVPAHPMSPRSAPGDVALSPLASKHTSPLTASAFVPPPLTPLLGSASKSTGDDGTHAMSFQPALTSQLLPMSSCCAPGGVALSPSANKRTSPIITVSALAPKVAALSPRCNKDSLPVTAPGLPAPPLPPLPASPSKSAMDEGTQAMSSRDGLLSAPQLSERAKVSTDAQQTKDASSLLPVRWMKVGDLHLIENASHELNVTSRFGGKGIPRRRALR